jgi:hypothetical protein
MNSRMAASFPQPPADQHKTVRFWGRDLKAVPIPNAFDELITVIENYLKLGDSTFSIFENALASPSDPWLKHTEIHTLTCGRSIYHILSPEQTSRPLIERTMKRSNSISPPLMGVLARFPKPTGFHSGGSLGLAELRKIAGHTEKLIVGAYDGEGYLIWSKSV